MKISASVNFGRFIPILLRSLLRNVIRGYARFVQRARKIIYSPSVFISASCAAILSCSERRGDK